MIEDQLPVSLASITDALVSQSDEHIAYYDALTGEVVWDNEELRDDPDEEIDFDDPRYIALPDPFSIDQHGMMTRFSTTRDDSDACNALLEALRDKKAFRRFREAITSLGLVQEWYTYRDATYEEIARGWAETYSVPLIDPPSVRKQ